MVMSALATSENSILHIFKCRLFALIFSVEHENRCVVMCARVTTELSFENAILLC